MLIFCNNFLAEQEFLFDRVLNKYYLTIHKNGSTSLENLTLIDSSRYSMVAAESVDADQVTVFVREPIERYLSGLSTQMHLLQLPEEVITRMLAANQIQFFDAHTVPQFWFLMAADRKLKVKFNIKPLSALNELDNIVWKNKTNKPSITLSKEVEDKLSHFYTEDIVLYNQFLNTTVTFDTILDKIRLEKSFIDDMMKYKDCLTQYF